MVGRLAEWRPPSGSSVVDELGPVLEPDELPIVHRLHEYTSRNMRGGVEVSQMAYFKQMLELGIRKDPRGGVFNQDDIEEALWTVYVKEKHNAAFQQKAATVGKSQKEYVFDQAYTIRILFGHLRLRALEADTAEKANKALNPDCHPLWMQNLYGMMSIAPVPLSPSVKNPFIFFSTSRRPTTHKQSRLIRSCRQK